MLNARYALCCALIFLSSSVNATLLFSEYVEGSSYNKALEIYNTGTAIDFSTDSYSIDIYINGATTPRYSIDLSGVIGTQGTYIIAHSDADTSILGLADLLSGSMNFNGDDAIVLVHNGSIVDRIGQVGIDPGAEWGSGLTSTQDNTLRRNTDILLGDVDAFSLFDPSLQWSGFAVNDFSGLGSHISGVVLPGDQGAANVNVPLPGSSALIAAGLVPLLLSGLIRVKRDQFQFRNAVSLC